MGAFCTKSICNIDRSDEGYTQLTQRNRDDLEKNHFKVPSLDDIHHVILQNKSLPTPKLATMADDASNLQLANPFGSTAPHSPVSGECVASTTSINIDITTSATTVNSSNVTLQLSNDEAADHFPTEGGRDELHLEFDVFTTSSMVSEYSRSSSPPLPTDNAALFREQSEDKWLCHKKVKQHKRTMQQEMKRLKIEQEIAEMNKVMTYYQQKSPSGSFPPTSPV